MATDTKVASSNGKGEELRASHILTAEAILKAKDIREDTLLVPEWGGDIRIQSFTKKEQQEIRDMSTVDEEIDTDKLEMYMFIRGVVEPRFTDDQYELLREKSAGVLDRVLNEIMKLSGMTPEQQKQMEARFHPKS